MIKKNDNHLKDLTIKSIDHDEFIKIMAQGRSIGLINEKEAPVEDLVHPLTYSQNIKKNPDMVAIPAAYSFQRNLNRLYKELKKLPN